MDVFDKEKRSRVMSKIKDKNTKPEVLVRSVLHRMGYRFRLHGKDLPGKPDIILPKYKKVIFVHGCFWHGHEGCDKSKRPSANREFWDKKLDKNINRDQKNIAELNKYGWETLIIWTCETKDIQTLKQKLTTFLESRE